MGMDSSDMDAWKGEEHMSIGYWRKHYELHGYMSDLWRRKFYSKEELEKADYEGFNGPVLSLSTEDLINLELAFITGKFDLDYTGYDEKDIQKDIDEDIVAIKYAIELSQKGWEITFCSSY